MRIRVRRVLLAVLGVVLAGAGGGASAAPAAPGLPDNRAYEQVTPVEKNGTSPSGRINSVQTSSSGDRIAFFSNAGLPGSQGSGEFPTFFASRDAAGWSDRGLLPPTPPGAVDTVRGWSEDLSTAALEVGGTHGGLDLRDSATGSHWLAVPGAFGIVPAGFSADNSHLIFESPDRLLPSAAPEVINLYDLRLADGYLSLAGVLPDGSTPPGGSFTGPYFWTQGDPSRGGASLNFYTQNTISADGSRVLFTAAGTGQIYVRENGASTVQVSASQRTVPDPNGPQPAVWMGSTPDGAHVFFTSCEKLTNDSTAVSPGPSSGCSDGAGRPRSGAGSDLYRYDVNAALGSRLTDLTADSSLGDPTGAAVQGVLGQSSDGSYVYFVANGVLASGASPGGCLGAVREGSSCSLYLFHNGIVTFIATLKPLKPEGEVEVGGDKLDWEPGAGLVEPLSFEKTSWVAADGKILLFRSIRRLTAFDNHGFAEFYRYDATAGRLACVSCNPTGAPPAGGATAQSIHSFLGPAGPAWTLTRNLSADGSRVFFESPDALLPSDTNGQQDVYEWEANGAGSCTHAEGCLFLLSTGTSPDPSYFADASVSGNDAFLFTSQPLVGQDQDEIVDIYDARVGGGIAAQNPPSSTPCSGEDCKPPSSGSSPEQIPDSASFSGPGNLVPGNLRAGRVTSKLSVRTRKLANALRICKRKPRRERASCVAHAKRRYGTKTNTTRRATKAMRPTAQSLRGGSR